MSQINHSEIGPKKVLQIKDAVFILPDDFNGNIQDAMNLFLEYSMSASKDHHEFKTDPNRIFTPLGILTINPNTNIKCCMEASLYELKDGYYVDMLPEEFDDK